jgi:hypothetical protein
VDGNESLREVVFTKDLSKVLPISFELIVPTLGSKNREVMFKFIMKDSYFKIKVNTGDEQFRLEAREVIGNQKDTVKSSTVPSE